MSCSLAITMALLATAPTNTEMVQQAATAQAPTDINAVLIELVSRSKGLKAVVDQWLLQDQADNAALKSQAGFLAFKTQIADLSRLNMTAHLALKAQDPDSDLPCIFRGISEDLPKRIENIENAHDAAERKTALDEMAYLLNDNAEVILAEAPSGH